MDFSCLVSAGLGLALYLNTLTADFAYDDSRAIVKNPDLLPETPLSNLLYDDFWGTPLTHSGSHKSYRPLCVLSFRLNYRLGGLDPWGYHLANVLLHAATAALFTALARRLLVGTFPTLLAGALFAAHPIHTEAVAGLVGRADVMACLFYLLALLCYMRYASWRHHQHHHHRKKKTKKEVEEEEEEDWVVVEAGEGGRRWWRWVWMVGVALFTAASLLTKEQAVTVLASCATYDVFVRHRGAPFRDVITLRILTAKQYRRLQEGLLCLLALGATFVGFRIYFMGNKPPEFAPSDNPASDSDSVLTRTLTYHYLPALNVWIMLFPYQLSFDWSMSAIPLVESVGDARNLATVTFYCCLGYLALHVVRSVNERARGVRVLVSSSSSPKLTAGAKSHHHHHANGNGVASHHHHHHHHHHHSHSSSAAHSSRTSASSSANSSPAHRRSSVSAESSSDSSILSFPSSSPGGFPTTTTTTTATATSPTWTSWRSLDVLILSLSFIVFPFIPASNLFFYVGFVIAERILYIPSMGFCLLLAQGAHLLRARARSEGGRKGVAGGVVAVLLLFSLRTWQRNQDWQTEEKLYTAGLKVNPAKAWGNLANVLNNEGRVGEAEEAYRNALKYRGNMADVHYNLGILLQNQGRTEEAVESYKRAIGFRPKLTVAHLNLGILTAQAGDIAAAAQIYRHCADLDTSGLKDPRLHETTKISCLYNLARLLADHNSLQEAEKTYLEALKRRPSYYAPQSIQNMLGELYLKMNQFDQAEHWYHEALRSKPDHIPAHLTLAKMFQHKNQDKEAELWFDKARVLDPNDGTIDLHHAQLLSTRGKHQEAAEMFHTALRKKPHDFDIIFSAANAFRQIGEKDTAEHLYRRAAELRPKEPTTHMNLGAMLHMNGKLSEAESSYLMALTLKPDDAITRDNLLKLRNLMASSSKDPPATR
ncbi:protein O-mannosyl-transferase TMTC2-like [Babylonia areolata]|uniref:protein O-mannosyl-transferase TMTC2-like n=1 Tax=Babylonia areolata TaxID=304850 RepID=UPI003FD09186